MSLNESTFISSVTADYLKGISYFYGESFLILRLIKRTSGMSGSLFSLPDHDNSF